MVTSSGPVAAADWKKMKVPELREELASRGLDTSGVKAALIERLEEGAPAEVDGNATAVDDKRKDMDLDMNEGAPVGPIEEKLVTGQPVEKEIAAMDVEMKVEAPPATKSLQSVGQVSEGSAHPIESPVEVVNGDVVAPSTDLQRKQRRAERFGLELMVSEGEKRRLRAARFGDNVDNKTNGNAKISAGDDVSKMSPTPKDAEAVKRKARAARFGIEEVRDKVSSPTGNDDAKKKARLARFGLEVKADPMEQEKKKLRAARFGLVSESKPRVEAETAVPVAVEQPTAV